MWRFANMLAVAAFAVTGVVRAQERAVTYYVQLIRSSDSEQPPQAGSRRVGAKLAETFSGVWKWKGLLGDLPTGSGGDSRPNVEGVPEQWARSGD